MPCLTLADRAHPLQAPAGRDRCAWVREQVESLLADPRLPDPQDGEIDKRWEWAAPLVLDPGLRAFLQRWRDRELRVGPEEEGLPRPKSSEVFDSEVFDGYLDDLLAFQQSSLGRRPPDLVDLLTEVALGSPAILASRCLKVSAGVEDDTRRTLATTIAYAFWNLFNQPAVISLIQELGASRKEAVYWRLVLHYCRQGNLQAVHDELRIPAHLTAIPGTLDRDSCVI